MIYTIELTEKQANQLNDIMLGINASWGYASAPKLKMDIPLPMTESVAYKKGLEVGNKIADKDLKEIQDSTYDMAYNMALKDVDHAMDVLKGMTGTECAEWFEDCVGVDEVVCGFTVQRIVEIIKAYEEKNKTEKIKVGDIVIHNDEKIKGIVYKVEDGLVYGTNCYFNAFEWSINLCTKIGHMNEVEQLVAELKGVEQ